MRGSGLSEEDVSNCTFSMEGDNCLEFTVRLKGGKSTSEVAATMEDNLSDLSYSVNIQKKVVIARIWSDKEELHSNANLSYSHA